MSTGEKLMLFGLVLQINANTTNIEWAAVAYYLISIGLFVVAVFYLSKEE